MKYTLSTIILILLLYCDVTAQSNVLDKTFGTNGKLISETYRGYSQAIALQSDQKIIVAGEGAYNETGGLFLARYNQDGSLDNTFGDSGRVVTYIPDYNQGFRSVAVLKNRKIIASGYIVRFGTIDADLILVQYNSDGSIDSAFGENGKVITNISKSDFPEDMIVQPDGKILITGNKSKNENDIETSFIIRYLDDGNYDESFGSSGIVTTVFEKPVEIKAIGLQSDGKIITSGVFDFTGNSVFLSVRYLANGSIDKTFADNGLAKLIISNEYPSLNLNELAVDTNNNITIIGEFGNDDGYWNMILARFSNDGNADLSFGTNGYTTPLTSESKSISTGKNVLLQQDGKMFAVGGYNDFNGDHTYYALIKLNANGSRDSSFAESGIALAYFENVSNHTCTDAALQSDGKVIVLGDVWQGIPVLSYFALVRFNNEDTTAIPQYARIKKWLHRHGFTWDDWPFKNISYYSVQRSGNGNTFNEIARLFNRNNQQQYSYEDAAPLSGSNYYRLAAVSADGSTAYSTIIAIDNNVNTVKIYPNPVRNTLQVEGLPATEKTKLTITDFTGNTRMSVQVMAKNYNWNISGLRKGNYILKAESKGMIVTKKFIKE